MTISIVAGIVTPKIIEKGVTAYSKSIKITVGSTGRYYEIGHRGAIKSEKAVKKLLAKDIADGYFEENVIPKASSIIDQFVKAYNKLIGADDE